MNTIQSNYPTQYQTWEQRKAAYDRMYDEEGNMRLSSGDFKQNIQVQANQGAVRNTSNIPTTMGNGYAIEKVGDDYVVFAKNPGIYSGGGKNLTTEQLEYLRGKYDMDNLSKEDRIKLLAELSCMGIISGQQAYEEAFPEKCSWLKSQQQNYGLENTENDLDAWIQSFLQRAMQAKEDMNKLLASHRTDIVCVESQRRTNDFYTKLAEVMNQLR